MWAAGTIALVRFPQTDLVAGKLRPVLLLARTPGRHGDWLICMVSSQLHQAIDAFDEVVGDNDSDFAASGLKVPSVARLGRLAVVDEGVFAGPLGRVRDERIAAVRGRLAAWLARG